MKILVFYQYFSTPKGSWGTRFYEFAREWVDKGHEVTIVTSIYSKSDLSAHRFIEHQIHDGIHVKVINIELDNRQSFFKRIYTFLVYSFVASYYALFYRSDLHIASSGPITAGIPALIAKWLKGKKYVFEVRDLWPDGAIELGVLTNKLLIKASYWLEKKLYKNAAQIVALSPGMRDHIKRGHKLSNVVSITNSANLSLFQDKKPLPVDHILQDKNYLIYTGNIGRVNNSMLLLNTAKELKRLDREDIKIVIFGEGQDREKICRTAKEQELNSFLYLGLIPKQELVPFVQNAMASIVPLMGLPILKTSSPNKLFESLASGVPVIQTTNGWMKEYLEENNAGFTVPPDDPKHLTNLLIKLTENENLRRSLGDNAMEAASKDFDQKKLAMKYLKELEELNSND